MKFTVTALELMDGNNSAKITLRERDRRTIYESLMFLHIPMEDFPLYYLGLDLDIPLADAAMGKKPSEPDYAVRP